MLEFLADVADGRLDALRTGSRCRVQSNLPAAKANLPRGALLANTIH